MNTQLLKNLSSRVLVLSYTFNSRFLGFSLAPSGFEAGDLIYTTDGVEHLGYYSTYLKNSMAWIKSNTPENAVFLNWWDYGHLIVAVGERESMSKNPSEQALFSVVGSPNLEVDPHERIADVATTLTTTDESTTKSIMQKYSADYLIVTFEDVSSKSHRIFHFAGLNSTDHASDFWYAGDDKFSNPAYTDLGKQTMIYRLYTNSNLTDFTQVYSDQYIKKL
ncbi:MAG: hypothetical protein NWE95_08415 [Candidatus Bathyarchaeota archaeon]|nr:hypothetical protein [Candidatus Bathyarchaeota archaeon]